MKYKVYLGFISIAKLLVSFAVRIVLSVMLLVSATVVQAAPPVLTISSGSTAFVEDGIAVAIDPLLTVAEPSNTAFNGATVAITTGYVSTEDRLVYATTAGVSGSFSTATGILTLTGSVTPSGYQAALRAVKYQNINTAAPNTGTRTIRYALGSSLSFAGNGHFYEFVTASGITWTAARDAAAARSLFGLQGYLTTVTSASENAFISSKLVGQGWMGANDAAVENDWRWVTGPEAGTAFWSGVANGNPVGGKYNNWSSGEPNQWGGDEDYAHFLNGGQWNDYPHTLFGISGYVVEYGGMQGDPTLQVAGNKSVTVTAQNDAPSFSAGATLSAINEDTLSPVGATVTSMLNVNYTDSDGVDALAGIAVSADASGNGVEGDWEYTTDGSNWYDIGSISAATALLLDASARLRFAPFTHYNGTPGALTVYAVDDSSATTFTSGATRQTFNTTTDNGTSKVSAAGVSVGTSINSVNDVPVLTGFGAVLDTTNEDVEIEITLAEMQAQGDEVDIEDGAISKFVVKAVSTGTLKIGTSAGAAAAWAIIINDTVDSTNNAYWTPAAEAFGTLNAFTAVAEDSGNDESTPAVQGQVMVTAIADVPGVTSASTNEDIQTTSGLVLTKSGVDGGEVAYFKITDILNGSLFKNDGSTVISNGDFITVAEGGAGLKFSPAANSSAAGSFDVQGAINSVGSGLSGVASASIIVTAVNDAPVVGDIDMDTVNFSVGDGAVVLDDAANATLTDIDSADLSGGNITVSITAGSVPAEDVLSVGSVGAVATSGSNVTHTDGFIIATFAGGAGGANLVVTLNSNATVVRVRDLLSALQYNNANDSATASSRTVQLIIKDGDGTTNGGADTSATQTVTVNILTAPILDLDGDDSSGNTNGGYNGSFTEGGGAVMVVDADAAISDDSTTHTSLTVTLTVRPDGDGVEHLSSTIADGATIDGDTVAVAAYNSTTGELIFTAAGGDGDGFLDDTTVEALMASVQYDNSSQNPDTTNRNIDFVVVDSDALTGAEVVSVISVNRTNDAPAFTNLNGAPGFTEEGSAVWLDNDVVVDDLDLDAADNYDGTTLTLVRNGGASANDQFSATGTLSTLTQGAGFTVSGVSTGTVTTNSAGILVLTFNVTATAANVDSALQQIAYSNSNSAPAANVQINWTFSDGNSGSQGSGGALSAGGSTTVAITAVDGVHTGTVTISGSVAEYQTLNADASNVADLDGLGVFTYQWQSAGSNVGSNSTAYTLVASDIGNTITVTVSFTDGGGTLETETSSPTSAVANVNDSPTGSVTIVGTTTEDQVLTASNTLADLDGLGTISYQWKRNGSVISSETNTTYILVEADVGQLITVTASYTDDQGGTESVTSAATSVVVMANAVPVVTVPDEITIDATGLFTQVDLGTGSATDLEDGDLTASTSHEGYFSPGTHAVTWTATDSAGSSGTAEQTVNVIPLVGLSKNQVSAEGSTASFKVILNGSAATYPVVVPYTVSGTVANDGSDHNLSDGSVTIESPDIEVSVDIDLVDDGTGEGVETLIITLGSPTNAVTGAASTHQIDIFEGNVAPEVELSATQGGGATRIVGQVEGVVTVTATVVDPNANDTHSYDWSGTNNALVDTDGDETSFTIDPSGLVPGVYTLRLLVSDGSESDTTELVLNVKAALPTLTAVDSDGDGVSDDSEGLGDSDGDGVPDYLDHSGIASNVVQEKSGTSTSFLMETEPGLQLSLGNVAFQASGERTGVSTDDVSNYANEGAGAEADTEYYAYHGGVFDFTVDDLPVVGQSVNIVMAQFTAIPANAVYRKLTVTGWQDFVVDANNSVASALGSAGFCPAPGDAAYVDGLTEGHWCVQLTIEDGGANDTDGEANGSIDDPGGVAEQLPQSLEITISGDGGSGASSQWLLLLLSLGLLLRHTRIRRVMYALPLLLMSANTQAETSFMPSYVGIAYLGAESDERSADFENDMAALGLAGSVTQTDLSRGGVQAYLGYQMNDQLAFEFGYVDLGDVTTKISGTAANIDAYLDTATAVHPTTAAGWTFNFVLRKAIHGKIDLLGKFGVLWWDADYTLASPSASRKFSTDGMSGSIGVALEVEATAQIPIRIGWERYRLAGTDIDAWTLGLGYRF